MVSTALFNVVWLLVFYNDLTTTNLARESNKSPSPAIPATLNAAPAPGGSNSAAAAKEMENLSVEQLQKMVELEEKTKVTDCQHIYLTKQCTI